mgnify:CR=1 FL=1
MSYTPNPNRCNDWECEYNKNGNCTIDECPSVAIMLGKFIEKKD